MLERSELALKILCLALGALLLYELSQLVARWNPLAHATVPRLPTLSGSSSAEAGGRTTNSARAQMTKPVTAETSSLQARTPGKTETNAVASLKPGARPSNAPVSKALESRMPALSPGPMLPMKAPDLPGPIQARVDRIAQSEILAPFIRPLPMALLGIAGDRVFLRAPNGQAGVIKEGGEVGGIKLLRIGTNRVLIEQDGQQKELTIFSGYGGESLLPKSTAPIQ